MIDIGLSKIILIGVVALVVVGPQRLPKLARMGGTLLGRAQRYINEVKTEVSREIELEQLQAIKKDMQEAANSVQQSVTESAALFERELTGMSASASEPVAFGTVSPQHMPQPSSSAPEEIALSPEWVGRKAKKFRVKKLAHTSAIPSRHKHQTGSRTCASSGASRAAKCRTAPAAAHFFH
ncbi:MAG TPA: Sec-independent protein translocase protein TatB [Noviherbaspirillum sp.]|nr:Sec-independent protein translocase protein TatB [Noviherbaspirillum sp.]